jgi:hypothetical protein
MRDRMGQMRLDAITQRIHVLQKRIFPHNLLLKHIDSLPTENYSQLLHDI